MASPAYHPAEPADSAAACIAGDSDRRGTFALHLPLFDSQVDHLACRAIHQHTSAGQADSLCSIGDAASAMGAFVEEGEDSDLHDGFGPVMASVVLADSARMARTGACGFYSALAKLGVVAAVRPTSVDEKTVSSRKGSAAEPVSAVNDPARRWRTIGGDPDAVDIDWNHASRLECYFVDGWETGQHSVGDCRTER